jgi:hypothetical protein
MRDPFEPSNVFVLEYISEVQLDLAVRFTFFAGLGCALRSLQDAYQQVKMKASKEGGAD